MNRWFLSLALCAAGALSSFAASLKPADLRCEYLRNPAGMDITQPRLSWVLQAASAKDRALAQSAWQVLVATSPKRLAPGKADLWDSGKVTTSDSIQVAYQGQPLASRQECFWKVRVWDQAGQASAWSAPAQWSMGLLRPGDWKGQWIGRDEQPVPQPSPMANTCWIWYPEGKPEAAAPVGARFFHRAFELPSGRALKSAEWLVAGDNTFQAIVNGKPVGNGSDFKVACAFDLRDLLRPGRNVLGLAVQNVGENPNPAGVTGRLNITFEQGEPLTIVTDESWKAGNREIAGWEQPAFDASAWTGAKKLGPVGMGPWGEVSGPEQRRLAARHLRKEFTAEKKVAQATVYYSGLGLSELYLNGAKVGDEVLSPGLTDYTKSVFYLTHDVTRLVRRGPNALGVLLGNGRFYAPRANSPIGTTGYGYPKLMLQLHLDYTDGTSEIIVSDTSWKLSADGPIQANNEYDGEEYDARKEFAGWTSPGFADASWAAAAAVAAPGGRLLAQMNEPIRVVDQIKPRSLQQISPGVYIYDMGQNMVGWCRLQVSGPAGATVSLRFAETLKPDGSLYLDNIRGAKVTDLYTLKGQGAETYEPRFTYHGFRFVELRGHPGTPTLDTLLGCVVNDDLEPAGGFACSHPMINRIYTNIYWGVRGNYRSMPTDCPQRDERQGWLGDRSAESKGETYLFRTITLYRKWLMDMADSQKESGSVSDVCPAYWPLYNDNVTWPSSTVIIPSSLREQYADREIIARHYDSAKKWMDYMTRFLEKGIISKDSYGDWCVPPEDPKLIHSNDPKRKTAPPLLATAYFIHDLNLMEQYASLLGKTADAQRFHALAGELKTAFNARFYNKDNGYYDNGTQTSCVLPLAFGLVPAGQEARVFDHLVRKITEETKGHIGTGLIGGQYLNRILSDGGRADLVHGFATHKAYPSWGYMVEKGATTIWELWNGDTADPAMNSGNHVMLVGDLVIWLYEYLAGIRPDPAQPGFKHIVMKPHPTGDLTHARATHQSPYGLIASSWQRTGKVFLWDVTVPANTTATLYIPAGAPGQVLEGGRAATRSPGLTFLRMEKDRAVFTAGSGRYQLAAVSP